MREISTNLTPQDAANWKTNLNFIDHVRKAEYGGGGLIETGGVIDNFFKVGIDRLALAIINNNTVRQRLIRSWIAIPDRLVISAKQVDSGKDAAEMLSISWLRNLSQTSRKHNLSVEQTNLLARLSTGTDGNYTPDSANWHRQRMVDELSNTILATASGQKIIIDSTNQQLLGLIQLSEGYPILLPVRPAEDEKKATYPHRDTGNDTDPCPRGMKRALSQLQAL